jgi:hypothetical protein
MPTPYLVRDKSVGLNSKGMPGTFRGSYQPYFDQGSSSLMAPSPHAEKVRPLRCNEDVESSSNIAVLGATPTIFARD